ncbi:MAG: TetR/AcrR family transcriptional regulator [Melioribacter sp.]|uniref:TetR/AcrR family transcriptional regulator n=1 Tax=Rosettibacter primus TaxID=3111523 RepID=UPI00247EDA4C|nr:TetR/AcrR family transcriptional regulator [Melioribacter sp.]
MNDKEKILIHAREIFFNNGFYKISMDEFASSLRMSKKTIYKHFPSKEELVKSTAYSFMRQIKKEIETVVNSNLHSIEKIVSIINILKDIGISRMSDRWLGDIRIHMPSLWKEIDSFRQKLLYKNISIIFSQGIKEGYIINVPHQIIINVFMSAIQSVINPDFIMNNNFSINEAINSTLKILINGILTEKGKKIYNKLLKNNNKLSINKKKV